MNIKDTIKKKLEDLKKDKEYKKKIEELKKRDPFVYKNF